MPLLKALQKGAQKTGDKKIQLRKEIDDLFSKIIDSKSNPDQSDRLTAAFNVAGLLFIDDVLEEEFNFIRDYAQKLDPENHHKHNQAWDNKDRADFCGRDGEIHLMDKIMGYLNKIEVALRKYINHKKMEGFSPDHNKTKIRLEIIGPKGTCERCQKALGNFLSDLEAHYGDEAIIKINARYLDKIVRDKEETGTYTYGSVKAKNIEHKNGKYKIEHSKIQSKTLKEMGQKEIENKEGEKITTIYIQEEKRRAERDAEKQIRVHINEACPIYINRPEPYDVTRHHYNNYYTQYYKNNYQRIFNEVKSNLQLYAETEVDNNCPNIPPKYPNIWQKYDEALNVAISNKKGGIKLEAQIDAQNEVLNPKTKEKAENGLRNYTPTPPTKYVGDYSETYTTAFNDAFEAGYGELYDKIEAENKAKTKRASENTSYDAKINEVFNILMNEAVTFLVGRKEIGKQLSTLPSSPELNLTGRSIIDGNSVLNSAFGNQQTSEKRVDIICKEFITLLEKKLDDSISSPSDGISDLIQMIKNGEIEDCYLDNNIEDENETENNLKLFIGSLRNDCVQKTKENKDFKQ